MYFYLVMEIVNQVTDLRSIYVYTFCLSFGPMHLQFFKEYKINVSLCDLDFQFFSWNTWNICGNVVST